MFLIGPFAHIGADLGHHRLGNRIAHPVHGHEINAGNRRICARVFTSGAFLLWEWGFDAAAWGEPRAWRLASHLETGRDDGEGPFDLRIAGAELGRVEIEQGQRWGRTNRGASRQVPVSAIAHLVRLLFTAVIAQGGQVCGVAFARDDRADDPLPSRPVMSLSAWDNWMFICKSALLHMEDMRGTMLKELGPMAQEGTQGDEVSVGAKRGREQPVTVEGLDPLQSRTSLLRPGTRLMEAALIKQQWRPRASSSSKRGIQ